MRKIAPLLIVIFPVLVLLWIIGWSLFTTLSPSHRNRVQEVKERSEGIEVLLPEHWKQVAVSDD